jgi:hypothetical protein
MLPEIKILLSLASKQELDPMPDDEIDAFEDEPTTPMYSRLTQVPEEFEVLSPLEDPSMPSQGLTDKQMLDEILVEEGMDDENEADDTPTDPDAAVRHKLEQADLGTIDKIMGFLREHPDMLAKLLMILI